MEAKIWRILVFSKISLLIFLIFFFFFLMLLNFSFFLSGSRFFSFSLRDKILSLFFSVSFDFISFVFIRIVFLVTRLVFLYSEAYMETYHNKKFFFLTLLFFLFIRFLACRGSLINVIIGWDGLGISSLFLIIFYPNKITFFNSFLTFFFNRLGDVFFLIFFLFFFIS